MTILLFDPDGDSGKFDEAHEVYEELVVSSCDAAELFELVEEALDDVALFVEIGVIGALDRTVSLGRDDDFGPAFGNLLAETIGVITLVADCSLRSETLDEVVCEGNVVTLSRSADQAKRIAKCIAGGVDFGAQAAAGPAKTLGIRPPFSLRAPAAC